MFVAACDGLISAVLPQRLQHAEQGLAGEFVRVWVFRLVAVLS
jgi:hypothetical protein